MVDQAPVTLRQRTEYPWSGQVRLELALEQEAEFSLYVRLPGWCRKAQVKVNGEPLEDLARHLDKGYLVLARTWRSGDGVELDLAMPVEKVYAHPKVRDAAGRIALQRGPVVYCLEEADNGPDLHALVLAADPDFVVEVDPELQVPAITARGFRLEAVDPGLYAACEPKRVPVTIKAVPYFIWDNRSPGEMSVWIRSAWEA